METNQVEVNNINVGEEDEPGTVTDETMQMEGNQVHTTTVLDEQSLQQLMDSGTVSEDRYTFESMTLKFVNLCFFFQLSAS